MMERVGALSDSSDPMFGNYFDPLIEGGSQRRSQLVAKYPLLQAHLERIRAVPNIKKWLETRPASKEEKF